MRSRLALYAACAALDTVLATLPAAGRFRLVTKPLLMPLLWGALHSSAPASGTQRTSRIRPALARKEPAQLRWGSRNAPAASPEPADPAIEVHLLGPRDVDRAGALLRRPQEMEASALGGWQVRAVPPSAPGHAPSPREASPEAPFDAIERDDPGCARDRGAQAVEHDIRRRVASAFGQLWHDPRHAPDARCVARVRRGLFFSWVGDCALLRPTPGALLVGMGGFWAAHANYLAAFARDGAFDWLRANPWAVAVAATVGGVSVGALASNAPGFERPVAAYGSTITAMALLGIATRRPLVRAGVVLFCVSDLVLGLRQFVGVRPPIFGGVVMATYTLAQGLIAAGYRERLA